MSDMSLARADRAPAGRTGLASLPGYVTFRRFRRHPTGMIGAMVLLLLIVVALIAPLIAPYDPTTPDPVSSLSDPSRDHPLGADLLGRDTLSRLMYGARVSLQVGLITMGIAALVGVPMGLV